MRYRVRHSTRYRYAARVTSCYNLAYVLPRDTRRQKCLSSRVTVSPQPAVTRIRSDYFGNQAYHFEIQRAHKELVISVESEIQVSHPDQVLNLDLGISYGQALQQIHNDRSPQALDAREYLLDSPMVEAGAELAQYAGKSFVPETSLKSCVAHLTSRIFRDFTYDPDFTTIATPLAEVLAHRRGVCQDFAHLQVGCLRAMGIPAKYVSGYIETLPAPGEEKLVGADATHAWVAYYCPDEGWVEFDPTNDTAAHNQHIVTAFGRDYLDVTPVKGVIFGGGDNPQLSVSVDVARLGEPVS
ncbi:transglutaminase family protein [Seongchinamella sediminis]|uniref:Transglutaminase family protein n=1 Tax=Seongchinamella sediminis TaxID=2283635 RepID=A0A3L7E1U5_9GAMM|nr:transglutaminase family protein [Seongchinamella sediminis]RLQ22241.1 transglutaminase family protein [Seongchinamella sediminis]